MRCIATSGTTSFGAVEIGALCMASYARRSAPCISVAFAKRWSRSNASERSMTSAMARGSVGINDRIGGAVFVMADSSISFIVRPS